MTGLPHFRLVFKFSKRLKRRQAIEKILKIYAHIH